MVALDAAEIPLIRGDFDGVAGGVEAGEGLLENDAVS